MIRLLRRRLCGWLLYHAWTPLTSRLNHDRPVLHGLYCQRCHRMELLDSGDAS